MNTIQIVIIIVLICVILYNYRNIKEGFDYQSNCVPEYIYRDDIGKLDRRKNFMLRDIRTNFWLIVDGGIGKFVPARFGVPFALSENPNDFLPLRMANDPNYYLLSDYDGQGIRAVSNPYTNFFKLEVLIYNQRNILAWEDEGDAQHFIYVDDAGEVVSTNNPDHASQFEMLLVQ